MTTGSASPGAPGRAASDPSETNTAQGASSSEEAPTQWRMLFVLTAIFALSSVDRGILPLLVEPIRADLGLTDIEISLLLGFSFVLLFSLCAIPAGYLADLMSRRLLIAISTAFWSVMAIVCGFANTFWQLFAGRLGLGAGEAGLPPAAFSLMRDGIRTEHRARAFSVYHMSPIVGKGIANWGGAILLTAAAAGAFHAWPVLGSLQPWQIVIIMPGLVGIPMALLLFTFREPARRRSKAATLAGEDDVATFHDLFAHVYANRKAYIPIYVAMFLAAVANGFSSWLPAAIGRSWDLTPSEIGSVLGPLGLFTGPITLLTFGYLMDRFGKSSPGAAMRVAFYGTILHLPPSLYIFLAPNEVQMWTAVGLSMLFDYATLLATSVALSFITPTRLMGKATAIYAIAANSGSAVGPTIFALISQFFFTGERALPQALLIGYPFVVGLSLFMLWVGGRGLAQVRAQAEEGESTPGGSAPVRAAE